MGTPLRPGVETISAREGELKPLLSAAFSECAGRKHEF